MSSGLRKDAWRGATKRDNPAAAPPYGQSGRRHRPASGPGRVSRAGRASPRLRLRPRAGWAPPARHGGGAPVPLGLRGADHAAAPPAQRVLPGAGGARPPPAAALAQRRHLRRLAGGLRALRAQRGTGPSAALGPAAARARRRLRPSLPRAGWPRVSPEQLWLAAPGAWRAAGARGKALSATPGHPPRLGNAELMSAWWQRDSSAGLRAAGCHPLAPLASRVPLLVCSLVTDRVDVCLGAERCLAHVCEYK